MKAVKTTSFVFTLLSLALAGLIAFLAVSALGTAQTPFVRSHAADDRTGAFMEAICASDHETAGSLLLSQPDLTPESQPDTALGLLLWDAFRESLSYEFSGTCQASGSGLQRSVTVTGLDIAALMHQLKDEAQDLLNEQALEADPDKVYKPEGGYQEAFVMDVLAHGAAGLLGEDQPMTTWELTLKLEKRNGQWWILPDQPLLDLLSGGIGS